MSFGFVQEDISSLYAPKQLYAFSGAKVWDCVQRPEYLMRKICLKSGGVIPAGYFLDGGGTYYVEEGEVLLKKRDVSGELVLLRVAKGAVFSIKCGEIHGLCGLTHISHKHSSRFGQTVLSDDKESPAGRVKLTLPRVNLKSDGETGGQNGRTVCEKCGLSESVLYFFGEGKQFSFAETEKEAENYFHEAEKWTKDAALCSEKTTNFREKYWGYIETILDGETCGKKIVMKTGTQSSLEFHCHKTESYFVHAGALKVGLRVGRGENTSVVVRTGESFDVVPGLMHMRIALEESIIFEISTKDSDRDSHLVEDGMKYTHNEVTVK